MTLDPNSCQKLLFLAKISNFYKSFDFLPKFRFFLTKISTIYSKKKEILVGNRNFCKNSKFWPKIVILDTNMGQKT